MNYSRPGFAILILFVSTMAWTVSRSSAQGVLASDLPQDVCGNAVLENPLLCGCFAYSEQLADPDWRLLREDCESELNGNIANGEDFCPEDFIVGGELQLSELGSFFSVSFNECAAPFYGLPPNPSPLPARIINVSERGTKTKFQHYFSGDQEGSFHPTVRMDVRRRGYYRLNNFCYTFVFHRRVRTPRARDICG